MHTTKSFSPSANGHSRNDFVSSIIFGGLVVLIFSQYLTTAVPAYLILMFGMFLKGRIKLQSSVVLYICVVIVYWFIILSYSISKTIVTHILFYFGFLFSLVALANEKNLRIRSFINEKVIIALCLLTFLEAILFNSSIGEQLYFFPPEGSGDRVAMLGFYQRPMGIAGNPSMTSVVLFFLIVLYERIWGPLKLRTFLLVLATTIVMASGTGFGLLLLYLLTSTFRSTGSKRTYLIRGLFSLMLLGVGVALAFGLLGEFENFNKFTIDYFSLMYEFKKYQFETMFEGAPFEVDLFGNQINPEFIASTSGDAGILITPHSIGVIGSAILFAAPLLFYRSIPKHLVPTLFFFVSFIHYPGLLSPPGQVLFACYLCLLAESDRQAKKGAKFVGQ